MRFSSASPFRGILLLVILTGVFSAGCSPFRLFERRYKYVQPTVAVFKFDNKVPVFASWNLGEAMDKAVRDMVKKIGKQRWKPVVAGSKNGYVVLNGGKDRRLKKGMAFHVIEPGDLIYDPTTGNLLGRTPGERIGMVQIERVFDKFSYARLVRGRSGEVGYPLVKLTGNERTEATNPESNTNQPIPIPPPQSFR